MALSRGVVVLFFLLLVVAAWQIGTIEAKKRSKHAKKTAKSLMKDKKEKEEDEEKEKKEKEKKEEEENHCLSQSHQFKDFCFSSDTCAAVCMKESFHGEECKLENALRMCFCKKPC